MDAIIDQETVVWVCQLLFVAAALIQFFYLFYFHLRVALYEHPPVSPDLPPVSVVIAARNEDDNLLQNLPAVLEQDYPKYDVVVVNDGSWDDSDSVLEALKLQYPHLYVITRHEHDRFEAGKKLAVTLGVKGAKHDRLILTDADCKPLTNQWIRSIVGAIARPDQLVLGYSPYRKMPGLLNLFIRFDALLTAMNYFGYALAGQPYMGVGRNLSYPKSRFFEVGGFRRHYSLASGDDDLFVNEIATRENTVVCMRNEAMVESIPEQKLKKFWRQKRRHLTTGRRYKPFHKFLLVLQSFGLLLFVSTAIVLIVYQSWLYAVISVVLLRFLIQIAIFRRSAKWLGQKDLAFLVPVLEIFALIFNACIHLTNATSKQSKWKT